MTTYKVYFRHNGGLNTCYIDATSEQQMKWKLISRFNHATFLSCAVQ